MRKILIILLLFICYFGFSQTSPTYQNITIRDQATIRQKAYFIPTISAPAIAREGMLYADTDHNLYYYNGTSWLKLGSNWTLAGNDITNANTGNTTVQGAFFTDSVPIANRVGHIMHWNHTTKQVEFVTPEDLADSLAVSGGGPWTFVDAAIDTLKNNLALTGVVAIKGNLELQTTTSTVGQVKQNGANLIHTYTDNISQPNIFIGNGAGSFTTTGNFNIGIGDSTLRTITTTGQNIAIGRKVLILGQAVANNSAVGYQSMMSSTGSDDNAAVGYQSLGLAVNSYANVALGASAMYGTATKSQQHNVAVGHSSMYSVGDGGDNNVAVGSQSLYSQKGRRGSVAIGYQSMYYGYSGVSNANGYNTAVGYQSMYGSVTAANNTGTNNTAVGAQALDAMTSGSFNTIYGYDAGGGLTTGDSNVLIGTSAGGQLTTQSDQLYIDNTNTTTPLIQGNFRTDELTINGQVFVPDIAAQAGAKFTHVAGIGVDDRLFPKTIADLKDTLQQIMSPSAQRGTGKNIEYWKADFSSAQIENGTNANVMVLGDSYAPMYGGWLKMMGGSVYGYGGGFEVFEGKAWLTYQNTIYCNIGAGWSLNYDQTDTKNAFSRYAESSTPGATIAVSAVNFNKFMLNYRQAVGDGVFSVQLGSGGTPVNVDANGAALSKWYTVNYGKITYAMPTDTIFIKNVSGTTRLYGYNIQYHPYVEAYSSAVKKGYLETHIVQNPGCAIYEMYRGKDTAQLHILVDSLQVSLAILTFLDTATYKPVECMDTLIQILQAIRPEMDIMIVNPIDEIDHLGAVTSVKFDSLATLRNTAYWNSFNTVGTYAKQKASGAQTDDIHFNFTYYGLLWKELNDLLFYPIRQTHRVEGYELRNAGDYMLFTGTKNLAIVSRNPGRMTSTANNTLIGYRDILFAQNTGTNNTYIGALAGNKTTSGTDNTGVGNNALTGLTTGTYNTALGSGAGAATVAGINNTFVGYNSGFYLTTGADQNTGVGAQSLGNGAVTGDQNVAIGQSSLYSLTSGANNVAVGYQAGNDGTAAKRNTFIGSGAGKETTYDYNFCGGYLSGNNNTSGYGNTSVGAYSLFGAGTMTGSLNTIIGYSAGFAMTNVSENNTMLGANAGLALTTGDNNVLLGLNAGAKLTTQGKQLYIANDTVQWANAAGADGLLIYGDFDLNFVNIFNRLAIGQAKNPTLALDVVGGAAFTTSVSIGTFFKLTPIADPPGSPEEGMVYMDTDHHLYVYNGTGWVQLDN